MIPKWAGYRKADSIEESCGSCNYFKANVCTMFENSPVESDYVCSEWVGIVYDDPTPKYTADPVDRSLEGEDMMRMAELNNALEPMRKGTGVLYLIAHGKTKYNQDSKSGDLVQGWKNASLDATGRKQAGQLAKFLKGKGVEEVYSSDLRRAQETATPIARAIGVKPVVSKDFRPWDLGDFAGHSSQDVLPKLKPYLNEKSDQPVDGGESFDSFKNRFLPALEKILSEVAKGHVVVLITHSRNVELVEGWVGGRGPRKQIDTSAISSDNIRPAEMFEVTPRGGRWRMKETVAKGQANPCEVNLRVHGVTRHPSGQLVYRMDTRDGHYVGRTNPTNHRALKGDILRVQCGDVTVDSNGDVKWMNANVLSHHEETAHSLKDLTSLAGGQFEKDGSGPSGESVPAATDQGAHGMPTPGALAASGPTISSVHVDRPLKQISVGYMKKPRFEVKKADKQKQIVYGVVLEPHVLDTQDDFMLPDQVEKAAHKYLTKVARGQATVSKLQHRKVGFFKSRPSVVPVESFIAPCDFSYDGKETVSKGTWVMAFHIEDENVWQQVMKGEFTGFSIGGTGIRQDAPVNPPLEQFNDSPENWFS